MVVVNMLSKPAFPVAPLRVRPEGGSLVVKPLRIAVDPLRDPMADVKRDAGKAVSALFAGLRAVLPTLAR